MELGIRRPRAGFHSFLSRPGSNPQIIIIIIIIIIAIILYSMLLYFFKNKNVYIERIKREKMVKKEAKSIEDI